MRSTRIVPADMPWWRDARFGMFLHWGPSSISGKEISWSRKATGETVYDTLHHQFNPTKFDARAWAVVAQAAGMKYVVLTVKHHDGFMLWDTRTSDYNIMHTPFRRDVTAELAAACRDVGIPFCIYFSPGDWKDTDCRSATHNDRFVRRMHAQLTELLTRFGHIPYIYFDYDGYPNPSLPRETYELVQRVSPGTIVSNRLEPLDPDESHGRLGQWGDFATPEQFVGSFNDRVPWETAMTIGDQWAWKPNDRIKSLRRCLETLVRTVGGDGNLLFNVGPTPAGEIEPQQVERLKEMGDWLARNGEAVYGTRGGPFLPAADYASTRTDAAVYVHVFKLTDGAVTLPPLSARVTAAARLDGAAVAFTQTATSLVLSPASQDANVTVIKLKIDAPPLQLAAVPPPSMTGSLAYRAPARVSSSVAPDFMHDAGAAVDDDDRTFWSPGRNDEFAAMFAGRNFEQTAGRYSHEIWQRAGWLEVTLPRPAAVKRIVIKEHRKYPPVTSWKIERQAAGGWQLVASGENIGSALTVDLRADAMSQTFRLSVEAKGRPAITEFQLFK